MIPGLVIGLREGLETVVILGAILVFLRLQHQDRLVRRVWQAAGLATAVCIALAVVLRGVESNLAPRPQQGFEAVVGIAAVAMVTYMVVWMRRFPKDLPRDTEHAAESALNRGSGQALVVMAFFAVLREGIEIVVFVVATLGVGRGNGWLATLGVGVGVAAAVAIGLGVIRGTRQLDIARFFRLSAIVLVVCAAGIAMTTVQHMYGAGWFAFGRASGLDLSWLAPPGTVLSSFTAGMFGIQPHPGVLEVAAWVSYALVMLGVVLWPAAGAARPPVALAGGSGAPTPFPVPAADAARRSRPAGRH